MVHERTWEKTYRDVDGCRNILLRIDASTLDQRALRLSKESCVLMPLGYSMPNWTSKLINEAGTCFVNGQYTGCIVSLAAGVEYGLRELCDGKPNHQLDRLIRDASNSKKISEEEKEKIKGSKVLVLNALRKEKHISHFTLDEATALAEELAPGQAYLTHMSHQIGFHEELNQGLPERVQLAYDGLELRI